MSKKIYKILLFFIILGAILIFKPSTSLAANISSTTITLSEGSYTYTGNAVKPSVTVKYLGVKLTEGKHYIVTYSNNVNAGTGKVTIAGKGIYSGSTTKTFTINKCSIYNNVPVKLSGTEYAYTGKAITPTVIAEYKGKRLQKNIDYTVSYTDNIKEGTGYVNIKGIGNYTSTVSKSFTIKKRTMGNCQITNRSC